MKAFFTLFSLLIATTFFAQSLDGSWQLTSINGIPLVKMEQIAIYQDGYFAVGAKEIESNKFLFAYGGEFQLENKNYTETHDFNTAHPDKIGESKNYQVKISESIMEINTVEGPYVWERIASHNDALTRNWVITGRERDGTMNTITPGDRRTVKILSGGRFQWIAFNSATKEFSGTGGGTYSAQNGVYTENITFFSRDDSRVGASLEFQFEVKDGQWHHRGKSSTGSPIYEIWSPYGVAYRK
jgi:hypothetical protein